MPGRLVKAPSTPLLLLVGLGACGAETDAPGSTPGQSSVDPPASSREDSSSPDPGAIGSAPMTEGHLTIRSAVIPEPTGGSRIAVYAEIDNDGPTDTLLGIASAVAARGSLHEMVEEGGMVTMQPSGALPVPAGGTLSLRSGARHGMLEGLSRNPAAGDTVSVTFVFASGGEVVVPVPVVPLTSLTEGRGLPNRQRP